MMDALSMEQLRMTRTTLLGLEEAANKSSLTSGECGRCIEKLHTARRNVDAVMKREGVE